MNGVSLPSVIIVPEPARVRLLSAMPGAVFPLHPVPTIVMEKNTSSLEFIARIALITSLTALSIDTMLPALPAIGESLQVQDSNNLPLVITLFIFGMFFGELVFGPLSDSLGRKKALTVGVLIYCCGTVVAMVATSLEFLLLGRMIQGFGVSGPKIISRAMIRDRFEGARMARVFSFIMTVFICIPMIAPALGQLIVRVSGWRAIFLVFLVMAVGATGWILVRQPETLPAAARTPVRMRSLAQTASRILSHPSVLCYSVTAGLVFGVFLLFLSTSQIMFEQIYDKGESFPVYFALLASGFGLAAILNSRMVMKYGMYRLCFGGLIGLTCLGGFFLATGEQGRHSFTVFMAGCYVFMFCVGVLFSNLSAMAMQPLGKVAGLGASLVSAVSSILAVIISVAVGRFYNNTLYPMSFSIVLCASLSLCLLVVAKRIKAEAVASSG